MALHLIVDGYNLIGRSGRYREARRLSMEAARARLVEDLRRYKRFKGFRITAVFDGSQVGGGLSDSGSLKGIRLVYSRGDQEADDVIVGMVRNAPEGVVVVTSDRMVARNCRSVGASIVSAEDFEEKLLLTEMTELKGGFEEPDLEPKVDTRKKGPAYKAPKSKRRDRRRRDRL